MPAETRRGPGGNVRMFNHLRAESKSYIARRFLILGVLFLALCVLAFVQYRWVTQLAKAERQQAGANLSAALEDLEGDFDIEVTRAFLVFQLPAARVTTEAQLYREWMLHAPYPRLIRGVYVTQTGASGSVPQEVLAGEPPITMAEWKKAARRLAMPFTGVVVASEAFRTGMSFRNNPPEREITVSGAQPNLPMRIGANPAFFYPMIPAVPDAAGPRVIRRAGALLRLQDGVTAKGSPSLGPPRFTLVVLNENYLRETLLPALIKRYFPSAEYEIEVVDTSHGSRQKVIFRSRAVRSGASFGNPDGSIAIFHVSPDCFPRASTGGFQTAGTGGQEQVPILGVSQILALRPSACVDPGGSARRADAGLWKVLVKYRAGSLSAAISGLRNRNFFLGGSVLLVLALGIAMLVILTDRAHSLAEMQTEFVLGISHELRTPLTVIRLAAENLKHGLVENSEQAHQYGEIIQTHAAGLSSMVEDTLALARIQSGGPAPQTGPCSTELIAKTVLHETELLAQEAGMEIELDLAPDLPPIHGEAGSLARCVENLIRNAIKYAAPGRLIAIRARKANRSAGGEYVEIAVEDRGPGISPQDLPHIFEPFYRGNGKESAQVPGVGLGLTLVKRVVEAHRGIVEVTTGDGAGTRFAILLPIWRSQP